MNLQIARDVINLAPRTRTGEAARYVLKLLDEADLARVEAAEAHLSVQAEALALAREEAGALQEEVDRLNILEKIRKSVAKKLGAQMMEQLKERDRLAKELEEARQPDPDLMRLRALEHAAEQLVRARPPLRAEGRAAYDYIIRHLTPHLVEPKVGP